jgi:hypothetical protein
MAKKLNNKDFRKAEAKAKELGSAIKNAEDSGIELQDSPDFWNAFIGLNDTLEAMGFGED